MNALLFLAIAIITLQTRATSDVILSRVDPLDLSEDNFDASIAGKQTFVKFFAPWCGHCKNLAPTWHSLAANLPEVQVAKVDCTKPDSKGLCERFGIRGYPTLKFFADNLVYDYNGGRSEEALKAYAAEGYKTNPGSPIPKVRAKKVDIDDRHVVVVTDTNISIVEKSEKTVMLEFYAPWCGHCKNLAPAYNELAATLAESHPQHIAVRCDGTGSSIAMKRYGVMGFPTLKVLKGGLMYDYNGERSAKAMLQFLLNPTGEAQKVPAEWGMAEELTYSVTEIWEDLNDIFTEKRAAMLIVFLSGLLAGCLLVITLSYVLFPQRKPAAKAKPEGKKQR